MSARPKTKTRRATESGTRTTGWVAGLSLLLLAAGFAGARWYLGQKDVDPPPSYVEFRKLDVASTNGLVVLSFGLEVAPRDVSRVERFKPALEAGFREELALLEPRAMYSREGKTALAYGLRNLANHLIGADLISGVYFGDFRIYEKAVPQPS